MGNVLKDIDYKGVFSYFEEISGIPRGSKNNKGISDYLVEFAKTHNLKYMQDEFLNVIIIKEASKGYEEVPTIILQGHMDMVCEKDNGSNHDFTKDGLELVIKDDYIYANGTTLGADNGIAIAYALSILESTNLSHPRLEVIITTDEEIGMDGAAGLNVDNLQGKFMINIDSENEDVLLSSSAGGLTGTSVLPLEYENKRGTKIVLNINGLLGGHSGVEIDKNRTNANLLMSRLLFDLEQKMPLSLIRFTGGLKDNAIPRESYAEIVIAEKDMDMFKSEYNQLIKDYKLELKTSEPNFKSNYSVTENGIYQVICKPSLDKIQTILLYAPQGVLVMSSDIKELVESSLNLGILEIDNGKAEFCYSVRSSVNSYKNFISNKLKNLTVYLGGQYYVRGEYPAWEYKKDSSLRQLFINVFKDQYGKEPIIEAIHAGLECGIIANKISGLDIVSLGPNMDDIHTPKERLNISSTKRVYDYIVNVLEKSINIKIDSSI